MPGVLNEMDVNHMQAALHGLRVVDLSRLLPGPFCSAILADYGASVTVIEAPRFRDNSVIVDVPMVQRNKRHMAVDLKHQAGREIFMRLAAEADVILEAFRPGVVQDLRVDYDSVKELNPRIIYCSLSGYGQYGPLAKKAVHDLNCVAYAGVLDLLRDSQGAPIEPGIPLAGLVGSLYAVIGVLLALHARSTTGAGQYIDVSMSDSLASLLALPLAEAHRAATDARAEARRTGAAPRPYYRCYRTKDGRYLAVGALEKHLWKQLCEKLERPFYADKQHDKGAAEEIAQYLEHAFAQRDLDEWLAVFSDPNDCVAGVFSGAELLEDEHAAARKMLYRAPNGAPQPGIALKFSATPGSVRTPPYRFGEHTREILGELGYTERAIVELAAAGTVWAPDIAFGT
ncbi:MAG: CaiB/BaiF CoA transferase family protein [Desulfomonilaceae bacterium]